MKNVVTLAASAVVGLVLAATNAQAAPIELIVNGGFDTGSSGWTLQQGASCANTGWESAGNPGGDIRLNSCGQPGVDPGSDPAAIQLVTGLTVGDQYQLRWDEALYDISNGAGNPNSFGVYVNGSLLASNQLIGSAGGPYSSFVETFIATTSSATIEFAAELNNGDISYRLDNVSLQAVPEPASLLLLGSGLVGAGVRRYRARKA